MPSRLVLDSDDYRRMSWRNGGGSTTELATHPHGASLDDFVWRISLADVGQNGPFSRFDGIDRIIVLLEGDGMRLEGPAGAVVLGEPLRPHVFSGETPIHCRLLGGPVRDFNLMLRRGRCSGSVVVAKGATTGVAPATFRFCYAASGVVECALADGDVVALAAGQSLLLSSDAASAPLQLRPRDRLAAAVVACMDAEP